MNGESLLSVSLSVDYAGRRDVLREAAFAMEQRLLPLLGQVGLPADQAFRQRYPRELSVGQAQRVLIAMAVMHRPRLLIADEPTSSLDAITTSEVLKLLLDLNRQLGMGILFISHDLLSVASFCHRIAILPGGQVVECVTPE